MEKQVVFGEDIRSSPVPQHTALGLPRPRILFEDAAGRRFGLGGAPLSRHLLLLGGTGSGKSNVFHLIIESLMSQQTAEDILFIFDAKGDFFRSFYRDYDPNHIVIGHGRSYEGLSRCWNIFGELEEDGGFSAAGELAAKEIGKQLFAGRESETQPFFTQAAADLTAKLLIDFERRARESGDRSRLNNSALADWIKSAGLREYTEMIRRNPDFASAQLYFGDPSLGAQQRLTPQALGVFGYLNAMCSDLFTGVFAQDRPGNGFSMRSLVRNRGSGGGRTVVFVEYDLSAGEVLEPVYRLLFDLALKEALGQEGRRPGNLFFVIDEFKLLPRLLHIDDALNFGRSLGVRMFAGLQSVSQIYAGYGEERGRAILSGFMNCFAFQMPDFESRRYVSERFGGNVCHLNYRSLDQPVSLQREGRVIEDWDFLDLRVGEAAVSLTGEKPFLFQFQDFRAPHTIL